MKRTVIFPILFLVALFLTLTASAADSAIYSVTLTDKGVTVTLSSEEDCTLFVTLYGADGCLLDVWTHNVAAAPVIRGAEEAGSVGIVRRDGVPAGSAAKALLIGADNKPLCAAVSADASGGDTPSPTPTPADDSDVYAILYADGTLVFQRGKAPESGREVRETFAVDLTRNDTPWSKARAFIYQVDFADKILPTSTEWWFHECTKLQEIKNITNLDTANVTNMNCMFAGCGVLKTLDLSSFNTAKVTDMGWMFSGCGALTALDLSGFDTTNVTTMSGMFSGCGALTTLDLSGFNTVKVTNMLQMFENCSALMTLDVSGFNTANVTTMGHMFYKCGALTTLNLSSFNTANVTNKAYMFYYCCGLTAIYVSEQFEANQTGNYDSGMFEHCEFLVGGNGTKYEVNHTDNEYARIDGGPSAPGYFTAKT